MKNPGRGFYMAVEAALLLLLFAVLGGCSPAKK